VGVPSAGFHYKPQTSHFEPRTIPPDRCLPFATSFGSMTEFVVRMDNRPGRLAALTEVLAAAGVNIEALAAFGYDGEGIVRLIVDQPEAARRTLRDAGLVSEEHSVLTTFLSHTPGQLAGVARKLADSGVNIDAVYVLNSGADGIELALVVDEPESALPYLPVRGGIAD
jgi:hypothetical protein